MDLRKLKTILELFEQSKIQEMEMSEGEEKLRLVKGGETIGTYHHELPTRLPPNPHTLALHPAEAEPAQAPDAVEDPNMVKVLAQMVGTFYACPSVGEDPFVKTGGSVTEGDTICIIEAMKLFNNVTAPVSGTVVSIEAQNEQPVGYGDVLMTIKTT